MKQRLSALLLLCPLLLFSACAGGPVGEAAAERELLDALFPHYETDISMTMGNDLLTAHIAHPTPEQCEVTLHGPDSVAGLSYRFRQDNVDLSYKELSFSVDADGMPATAPVKLVVDALAMLLRVDDPEQLTRGGGGDSWELRGQLTGAGECVLLLDAETMTPQKLFLPALEWEIALENFVSFA